MSASFLTADQAAQRLGLHPKTVRRYIREGRLPAVRIGKSYRILASDIGKLTGETATASTSLLARVTSVVDVEGVDAETAERLARYLPAALNSREASGDPLSLNVIYDPERRQLKIVMAGSTSRVAMFLSFIEFSLATRS